MNPTRLAAILPLLLVPFSLAAPPASAQITLRASVTSTGALPMGNSMEPAISSDGRRVVFASSASDLVPGDTNACSDIFGRDLQFGVTGRLSVATSGLEANGGSGAPSISSDGRFVAFESDASNLVANDTNHSTDVFVRDLQTASTERVSVATGGAQANAYSSGASISADGRYVVFWGNSSNLVPGDTNGTNDVFLRDRQASTTERVSVTNGGGESNGPSYRGVVSADGRWVAFFSDATNLVAGDTNGVEDVFVRDRISSTTVRVSLGNGGVQGNDNSGRDGISISSDGRYVAFDSLATNLVANDLNAVRDVFVRDLQLNVTERLSLDSTGIEGNQESRFPTLSANGRFAAFTSKATNLVPNEANTAWDIFLRDRQTGTTTRASVATGGAQGDADSYESAVSSGGSVDGRFVVFSSSARTLVAGDPTGYSDIFVRDLETTGFPSLCNPGDQGVATCPCANPPTGLNRGCDNSSATGGAYLSATGHADLSSDDLVFHMTDGKPTALCCLLQGNAYVLAGAVYGQGVRCAGGSLKRLYSRNAVGGAVTLPNPATGDMKVHARSAAKGDLIQAGQNRWYFMFYRDPSVIGGCPAASTFNSTQTRQATWSA